MGVKLNLDKDAYRAVYLDCEFVPGDQTMHGLISIGLTDEDGLDYYAVNADLDEVYVRDHYWLGKNVWPYLPQNEEGELDYDHEDVKTTTEIRQDVTKYFGGHQRQSHLWTWYGSQDVGRLHWLWDNDWSRMPGDIPQWSHELQSLVYLLGNRRMPVQGASEHHALADARFNRVIHNHLKELAR